MEDKGEVLPWNYHLSMAIWTISPAQYGRSQALRCNSAQDSKACGGYHRSLIPSRSHHRQSHQRIASQHSQDGVHVQTCGAGSQILVQHTIYDAFLDKFSAAAKNLQVFRTQMEVSVMSAFTSHALDIIAREEGAAIYAGGARHGGTGFLVQPTVFSETNNMRAIREKIFEPVACIIKFAAEEVLAISALLMLEAGNIFVDNYDLVENKMPFEGHKQSGYGRELEE
ncbi:ALDH-like protein [Hymenopellis radicata]|nr:ALDH-like protein [Hymenopellis radicata]